MRGSPVTSARDAHAPVALHQRGAFAGRDGLREQRGVGIAKRRLEAVRQAFGDDAEQRIGTVVVRQTAQQFRRPRRAAQAAIQQDARRVRYSEVLGMMAGVEV